MTIQNSEILFIINPNSGTRRYKHLIKKLKKIDQGLTYIVTRHNETAKEMFDRNLDKYKVFVVVGGDGTVHEAARYLYNRADKYLAVVPNGSGNGFAYELGFTRSLKSLMRDIHAGETMSLDVLELNGEECINIGGVGFDSYVAHRFSRGKTRGLFTYIAIVLRSIFLFKPVEVTLTANGKEIRGKFLMICFANNKQFGNYAFIAPFAKPNDGIYDIVLMRRMPFYLYPGFLVKMFTGRLSDSKYMKFIRTSERTTLVANSREFHIDGEPVLFDNPVEIKLADKYLKVIRTRRNRL
jgi:YegS/Rv2252/BmrU family lipid kinase